MVQYKKFCLEELFSFETGNVDLQQKDINGKGCYFINSGLSNTGVKGKTDREAKVFPPNTITVDFWGNAFYRDFEYKLATHNHVFSLSGDVIKNREVGLYLVSQMTYFRKLFSFNEMATIKKLKKLSIELPIDSNGDFDWVFMESFIKDIEQRYISGLKQETSVLPKQYLAASGLDDYKLTDEDIEVLDYQPEFQEFCMGDLFDCPSLKWRADHSFNKLLDLSTERTTEFDLPLVNAKDGNNGIMYYGRKSDFNYVSAGIDIVNDGAVSTGNVYPQPHDIGVLYNAYIVTLKNGVTNTRVLEYLSCVMQKAIKHLFDYANKASWRKVQKIFISLPVDSNGEPDWDYMERYIKAIEKLVIKKVVDEKKQFITKTKEVVNCA